MSVSTPGCHTWWRLHFEKLRQIGSDPCAMLHPFRPFVLTQSSISGTETYCFQASRRQCHRRKVTSKQGSRFLFTELKEEEGRERSQTREQKDTDASLTMRTINVYSANNENCMHNKVTHERSPILLFLSIFLNNTKEWRLGIFCQRWESFHILFIISQFQTFELTSNRSGRIRKFTTIFPFDCQTIFLTEYFRTDPSSRIWSLKNLWIRRFRTSMIY